MSLAVMPFVVPSVWRPTAPAVPAVTVSVTATTATAIVRKVFIVPPGHLVPTSPRRAVSDSVTTLSLHVAAGRRGRPHGEMGGSDGGNDRGFGAERRGPHRGSPRRGSAPPVRAGCEQRTRGARRRAAPGHGPAPPHPSRRAPHGRGARLQRAARHRGPRRALQ